MVHTMFFALINRTSALALFFGVHGAIAPYPSLAEFTADEAVQRMKRILTAKTVN